MQTRRILFLLIVAALTAVAACGNQAADDPTGTIEGAVSVEGGDPAVDALIAFDSQSRQTRTKDDGTFTFEDIDAGTYTLRISLQGYVTQTTEVDVSDGQTAEPTITLQEINEPPTIRNVTLEPETLEPGASSSLTVDATDPNPADSLSYSYEATGEFAANSEGGNSASIVAPDEFDVQGSVTVRVEDEEGRIATERLSISTRSNSAPSINSVTATPSTLQPASTGQVVVSASDAQQDSLSYDWSAPDGWSFDDSTVSDPQLTAPNRYGANALLEVTVSDEHDFSSTATIGVSTTLNNGPIISSVTATPSTAERGGSINLEVSAADPNDDPLTYQWSAPGDWTLDDDTSQSPTLTAPSTPGASANIQVTVEDEEGLSANGTVVVSTAPNRAPRITGVLPDADELSRGGSTQVTVEATDPEGDNLSYGWTLSNENWTKSGNGATVTIDAPNTPSSSTLLKTTVTDAAGASTTDSVILKTVPNQAPVISSIFPTNNPVARGGSTQITVNASDPNGDSMNYTWSVNDPDWSIAGSGSTVTANAPSTPDESVLVTVTVEDSLGKTVTGTDQISTASNKAPTITSLPTIPTRQAAGRVDGWTYQATASDPDDTNLTWTVDATPSSTQVSIDNSGLLTFSPDRQDTNKTFTLQVSASDGTDSATQTFSISVGSLKYRKSDRISFLSGIHDVPAVGDFDGDGLTDLATSSSPDDELVYVLSSDADPYMTENEFGWTGGGNFQACEFNRAAHVDGDSSLDVVTTCDENGSAADNLTIATWINDLSGSGGFQAGNVLNTGLATDAVDMRTADITGDDADEVVVADASNRIHIFANDGSGGLIRSEFSPEMPDNASSSWSLERIFLADVSGANGLELVTLEYLDSFGAQIAVYNLDATGSIVPTSSGNDRSAVKSLEHRPHKLELADFDDDGDVDLLVKSRDDDLNRGVRVHSNSNNASASFSLSGEIYSSTLCSDEGNRGMAVGDMDGDGHTDVVLGNDCNGSAHIAYGDGSGGFSSIQQTNRAALGTDEAENVFVGASNNDGTPDIFLYDYSEISILY